MDLDLDITQLARPGRRAEPLTADVVRPLTTSDLALLEVSRETKPEQIKRLTERHHQLARLLAEGKSPAECSLHTGYGLARISILQGDPTFQELVAHYKRLVEEQFVDVQILLKGTAIDAINALRDAIDEGTLTTSQLMEVAKFAADRSGHGPQTSQNVNINANIGERLDAARRRLQLVRAVAPVEDAEIVETTDEG